MSMLSANLGEDLVSSWSYRDHSTAASESFRNSRSGQRQVASLQPENALDTCGSKAPNSTLTFQAHVDCTDGGHFSAAKDFSNCDITYPTSVVDRQSFRTKEGKRVTEHQWAVYDFTRTIPVGKVATYKSVCAALGEGSPRSVGNALRNNPFVPFVPCHRVVASNFFVGGFNGEWGTESGTKTQCRRKMEMLEAEGVTLTSQGYLFNPQETVWLPVEE
ncbi:hypothetical protein HGRIS_009027 [Hohenbuehelia grisea]|uniref:Methylated-DNA--protein-cysteine methyltransferase n=1 Tax=Hohenbuehelia grisea TaxID=104357 RepID=A0ABR3IZZ7_9AGAR